MEVVLSHYAEAQEGGHAVVEEVAIVLGDVAVEMVRVLDQVFDFLGR